tara:strand:+ start:313 stop:576 length:264 start_codon:yes stop_codon:yes gene_type:complete
MYIFQKANYKLNTFIQNNLDSYHKLRNYDYGIENSYNLSQISKYISHRILYEYNILKKLNDIDKKNLQRKFFGDYIEKDILKITSLF